MHTPVLTNLLHIKSESEISSLYAKEDIYQKCLQLINDTTTKNPEKIVITNPEVIILVDSKVGDYESRCAIRATWSHHHLSKSLSHILSYVVYFQLGYEGEETMKHVQHENQLYGDVLIHKNILEKYGNVGKKLLASLEYIQQLNLSSLKFVVKTDDDIYVKIKDYLLHLKEIIPQNIDYEGILYTNMPVIRDKNHKNYEPYHPSLKDVFPPYCSGGGYFIRVTKLKCLKAAAETRQNFRNSDSNIGFLLQFCNTTMKNNANYGYDSIFNINLVTGVELLNKGLQFYFMHGIRKYDQILYDMKFQHKNNS